MDKISSTIAREDNGNIQIIFTIPTKLIISTKTEVLKELAKNTVIPGFRKGMAPITKVESKIPAETLKEHILNHILPKAFSDCVTENKLNPAIYPKFEIANRPLDLSDGKDWQIKATTCELPKVNLKDYQNKIAGEIRSKSIVVPGKEITKEEKENNLIKAVLDSIKLTIPKILIEEEVNGRLSQLLEKIEKLGLSLEGYLKSVGKTPEKIREEYGVQAKDAISLELILNEIAEKEKIEVKEKEIDEFIKTTGSDPSKVKVNQRKTLKRILLRRSALDKLASLV